MADRQVDRYLVRRTIWCHGPLGSAADQRPAELSQTELSDTEQSHTELSQAKLSHAVLSQAKLS